MSPEAPGAGVRRAGRDAGLATAELAACLPVLVLLLAVAVSVVSVAGVRVRAQDAATEAARAAARGDRSAALRLAASAAPGARVQIRSQGADVVATATVQARLLASWLPAVTVTATAVAALEPGAGTAGTGRSPPGGSSG
jgi:Flp pilus assembly protein TadG